MHVIECSCFEAQGRFTTKLWLTHAMYETISATDLPIKKCNSVRNHLYKHINALFAFSSLLETGATANSHLVDLSSFVCSFHDRNLQVVAHDS